MNPNSKADIEICLGPECRTHGGPELSTELERLGLVAERGHCRGLCIYAPVIHLGQRCIPEATVEHVLSSMTD